MKNRLCLAFLSCLTLTSSVWAQSVPRPPQFVCIAFDGSYSLDMWDETLSLAKELTHPESSVHFTYFINSVYLLHKEYRKTYHPPEGAPGTAPLEFPTDFENIQDRIRKINRAIDEGHEIGSHTAGHRFGARWTQAQWQTEFDEFNKLLFNYVQNNHLNPVTAPVLKLKPEEILGFRAPGLSFNDNMFSVLKANHFLYDTSKPIRPNAWPNKVDGLWIFGLPTLPLDGTKPTRWTYAMDYNFYQADTNLQPIDVFLQNKTAREVMLKRFGTDDPQKLLTDLEDQCYRTLKKYFLQNYYGTRAPVHIGFHFSLFQNGIYWRALKKVITEISQFPEVKMVSYKELVAALESTPVTTLTSWTQGQFTKLLPQQIVSADGMRARSVNSGNGPLN